MARPLSTSEPYRGGMNGSYGHPQPRYSLDDSHPAEVDHQEMEHLRSENTQLRSLCAELEQALQDATQQGPDVSAYEERLKEYELLLDEKTETIGHLHQELETMRLALEESSAKEQPARRSGPAPREEELLTLSEELERERRQLQEDEQALMEQMRQMEMSMARERAEMARQRNDLQRLHGEIRHELERLERNGALQSKMEDLKAKLQDATNRRGSAPAAPSGSYMRPASSAALPNVAQQPAAAPVQPGPPSRSVLGRLFGGSK